MDFSQIEGLAGKMGVSPDMLNQVKDKVGDLPDLSQISAMLQGMDLSNVAGKDLSFIKNMDLSNLSPENVAQLTDALKDIIPGFGKKN